MKTRISLAAAAVAVLLVTLSSCSYQPVTAGLGAGLTEHERNMSHEEFARLSIPEKQRIQKACVSSVLQDYRSGIRARTPGNIAKGVGALAVTHVIPVAGALIGRKVMEADFNANLDAVMTKDEAAMNCYIKYKI